VRDFLCAPHSERAHESFVLERVDAIVYDALADTDEGVEVTRANDSVTTSAHFSESQHVYLLPTQSWAGVVFEPSTRLSSTTIPIAKEVESPSCEATESKTDRVGRGIFQRADSHSPRGLGEREVVDR
jgi:hypothetical protein